MPALERTARARGGTSTDTTSVLDAVRRRAWRQILCHMGLHLGRRIVVKNPGTPFADAYDQSCKGCASSYVYPGLLRYSVFTKRLRDTIDS